LEVALNVLGEEPVELRDRMRALAAVAPDHVRSRLADEIAILAIALLRAAGELGADGVGVEVVCRSYQRELWLWLVGERRWDQCSSGLLGRLARRGVCAETTVGLP
jgi:hypothetical protein